MLIIEDNVDIRRNIEEIVREVDGRANIYAVSNTPDAYKIALEKAVDLFLIDIVLEEGQLTKEPSGIIFAEKIRKLEQYFFTPMIFITGLEDPKMHAYAGIHCYAYIEKPFDPEIVKGLVGQAIQYNTEKDEDKYLYIRKHGVLYPVPIKSIVSIDSQDHILQVRMTDETVDIQNKTCKTILEELDSNRFVQCSRNTIVNQDYIRNIDVANYFIDLKIGDKSIEIGPAFRKSLLEKLGL